MGRFAYPIAAIFLCKLAFADPPYSYPKKNRIHLDPVVLSQCLMGVADKYPNAKSSLGPRVDRIYENSTFRSPGGCTLNSETFFYYLMASDTRPCDFRTGLEPSLREWILSQSDDSVDPVRLFARAMELNQGDVFDSLLTIHQLLRNEARWMYPKFYDYKSSPESEKKFWDKFVDIRGDLKERGGNFTGDHKGSWYRLFGIILYRIAAIERRENWLGIENCPQAIRSTLLGRGVANFKAFATGFIAEAVKVLISQSEEDRRKIQVNMTGADIGGFLSAYGADPDRKMNEKIFGGLCKDRAYLHETGRKAPWVPSGG